MSNLPPLHNPPSTNGYHNHTNGSNGVGSVTTAAVRKPQPTATQFPSHLSGTASLRTWLYHLTRQEVGGAPMLRWLVLPLILLAAVWVTGWLPGRWLGAGLLVTLLGALIGLVRYWRRRDFVRFVPGSLAVQAEAAGGPLDAADKLPIYATGHFHVEGKKGRFTALPGFYRTFATREHALLCRFSEPRFLGVGRWPEGDFGMWYAFLTPDDIARIETGHLRFDGQPRPTIAVQHRVDVPKRGFRSGTRTVLQTVFITPTSEVDSAMILADLLHDRAPAHTTSAAFEFAPTTSDENVNKSVTSI